MSGEREGEGERLAGFIADGLHDSGVLGATDIQRATAIAAEEIAVSKAMGAYWCSWCCLKPEAAAGVQANDEAISFERSRSPVRAQWLGSDLLGIS